MTDPDPPLDSGTAPADSPAGGGRGRSALLGLVGLVAVVALIMLIVLLASPDNSVPAPQ